MALVTHDRSYTEPSIRRVLSPIFTWFFPLLGLVQPRSRRRLDSSAVDRRSRGGSRVTFSVNAEKKSLGKRERERERNERNHRMKNGFWNIVEIVVRPNDKSTTHDVDPIAISRVNRVLDSRALWFQGRIEFSATSMLQPS